MPLHLPNWKKYLLDRMGQEEDENGEVKLIGYQQVPRRVNLPTLLPTETDTIYYIKDEDKFVVWNGTKWDETGLTFTELDVRYATKTELGNKADKQSTYTKTQTDDLLKAKAESNHTHDEIHTHINLIELERLGIEDGFLTIDGVKQEIKETDLSNYYNKQEIDTIVQNVSVDLSGYYEKHEVDAIIEWIETPDLTPFALKVDIPDISGKADTFHTHDEFYQLADLNLRVSHLEVNGGGGAVNLHDFQTEFIIGAGAEYSFSTAYPNQDVSMYRVDENGDHWDFNVEDGMQMWWNNETVFFKNTSANEYKVYVKAWDLDKQTGGNDVDLSDYYTKAEVYNKQEIDTKLSGIDGGTGGMAYDDTAIKQDIASIQSDVETKADKNHTHDNYALKTAIHTHANQTDLDKLTIQDGKLAIDGVKQETAGAVIDDGNSSLGSTYSSQKIDEELVKKANASHGHALGDVTGLTLALSGKADTTHNHQLGTLSDVDETNKTKGRILEWNGTKHVYIDKPITDFNSMLPKFQTEDALKNEPANQGDLAIVIEENMIYEYGQGTETTKSNLPIMTSNVLPAPFALTASSYRAGNPDNYYQPFRAFDGSTSTQWVTATTENEWVIIDQGVERGVRGIAFTFGGTSPKEFKVSASNVGTFTGEEKVLLHETDFSGAVNTKHQFFFDNKTPYQFVKIDLISTDSSAFYVNEIEVYGNAWGKLVNLDELATKNDLIHTHTEKDIVDLDKYTKEETDNLLDEKADEIHTHDDYAGKLRGVQTELVPALEPNMVASIGNDFYISKLKTESPVSFAIATGSTDTRVTTSSQASNYPAAYAFTSNSNWNTNWLYVDSYTPQWVQFDVGAGNEQVLGSYRFRGTNAVHYQILGSNDNIKFDVIEAVFDNPYINDALFSEIKVVKSTTKYRYFRFVVAKTNDTGYQTQAKMTQLELFPLMTEWVKYTPEVKPHEHAQYGNKDKVIHSLSDVPTKVGLVAIEDGKIFRSKVENPAVDIVPKMTSNTAPTPIVITQSSAYNTSTTIGSKMFDDDPTTYFRSVSNPTVTGIPEWVKVDLGAGNEKAIGSYSILRTTLSSEGYNPKDWVLEGSNNDVDWTKLSTVANEPALAMGEKRIYPTNQQTPFRYYRLSVSTTHSTGTSTSLSIGEMELLSPATFKWEQEKEKLTRQFIEIFSSKDDVDATKGNFIMANETVYHAVEDGIVRKNPIMSSENEQGLLITSSGDQVDYPAWKLSDDYPSTIYTYGWRAATVTSDTTVWVAYTFKEKTPVSQVAITISTGGVYTGHAPKRFDILGDGVVIGSFTGFTKAQWEAEFTKTFDVIKGEYQEIKVLLYESVSGSKTFSLSQMNVLGTAYKWAEYQTPTEKTLLERLAALESEVQTLKGGTE